MTIITRFLPQDIGEARRSDYCFGSERRDDFFEARSGPGTRLRQASAFAPAPARRDGAASRRQSSAAYASQGGPKSDQTLAEAANMSRSSFKKDDVSPHEPGEPDQEHNENCCARVVVFRSCRRRLEKTLPKSYKVRRKATTSAFSCPVNFRSSTRLKYSTVSSSVSSRPSCKYGGVSFIPRSGKVFIGPSDAIIIPLTRCCL